VPFFQTVPYCVVLENSDTESEAHARAQLETLLEAAVEQGCAVDAVLAENIAQARALWHIRESIPLAQAKEGLNIKHDISIAVSRIPDFVAQAEAALAQARQRYGQAGAMADAASARAAGRTAEIASARSRLLESEALLARVKAEFDRRQTLAGSGAVSNEELGAARAALAAAMATRDAARTAVAAAQDTARSAAGDAAAAAAMVRGTSLSTAPDIRAAEAALAKAKLDLDRTVIKAPVAGIVTNRNVQIGQRVAGGAPLMTLVPTVGLFVDANFKESQLKTIRLGQSVELESDLYGGSVTYHGKVVGMAGGTGAAFALIPAQNVTGNWVKVVQRLPVRIALDDTEVKANPLRVGLSMTAVVDTRE
jgi:membrane fusion protein (multidrug efflux system)